MGRFLTKDPSGLESNTYRYAGANPINNTDPTGLFSPQQIAISMYASSFDDLAARLLLSVPPPLLPDDNKWGFFSALLDANDGDHLQVGGLVLTTNHPHIQYRQSELLWSINCDHIMVGRHTLWDFLYGVLTGPTYRDLAAEYWRDTSPSYYILSGSNGSRRYVDGTNTIDIPDFHSLDISAGFGSYGIPANFNMSFIDDRFGNQYLTFPDITLDQSIIELILKRIGKDINISFPVGAAYSEGYVCTGGHSIRDCVMRSSSSVPSNNTIFNTIKGPCYSAGGIIALGMKLVSCSNGTSAVVYSYGYAASIGGTGSIGIYTGNNPSSGWNWAVEDRLNGVSYVDLVFKAKSKEH